MKKYLFLIIISLLFLMNCSSDPTSNNGNHEMGTEVGNIGPDFTYTTLDNDTITLSDYRGKVVLLYLFGNECPYCLASGNLTESKINQMYKNSGDFQAIGLDLWDATSTPTIVNDFKSSTGITYPLCLQAGNMTEKYATTYDRLIILDKDGVIQFKGTTAISFDIDDAADKVSELLK